MSEGSVSVSRENLTGYPSIDKPWKKYYRQNPIRDFGAEQKFYNLIFNANEANMSDIAIEYLGVKWSYQKLKDEVEKVAASLKSIGINAGDIVVVGLTNLPEVVAIVLAVNKIGAVTRLFDLRASECDIKEYLVGSHSKLLVAQDILIPRIKHIFDSDEKLENCNAVILRPCECMPKCKRIGYRIKSARENNWFDMPKEGHFLSYDIFLALGKSNNAPNDTYKKEAPAIIVQSSGTTGKPKSIIHTDFSVCSSIKEMSYWDLPIGKGKGILNLLPPWIIYGMVISILWPLATGSKVILCPYFSAETMIPYLGEFTFSFAAPLHYRYLYDKISTLNEKQKRGLKRVECFASGGDKMSIEENQLFEKAFGAPVVNGYGNNEACGPLACNPMSGNRYGSVGIPRHGDITMCYDNESCSELRYGEVGEICALSDAMFLQYASNEEETKQVVKQHSDGKCWLHTGDLGYMDSDGFIFLSGRLRRVIICAAYKISAYTIEDAVSKDSRVKECVAVQVDDEKDEHAPFVFVSLNDGIESSEEVKDGILNTCKGYLKEYEMPRQIHFVSTLPYTDNNKYDFRQLEKNG